MMTYNLCIEVGLVNGALGWVQNIFYVPGSRPLELPMYMTIVFDKYVGVPLDIANPRLVPIAPVVRGSRKQIPLKMAWAITIHKSQGLTLDRDTIDIGNREQQWLTFTTISRVKSLDGLLISPPFTFERYAKMKNSVFVTLRKKEEE